MESRHNDVLDYLLSLPNVNLEYKDKVRKLHQWLDKTLPPSTYFTQWGQTIISLAQKMNPDALPLFSKHQKAETVYILYILCCSSDLIDL